MSDVAEVSQEVRFANPRVVYYFCFCEEVSNKIFINLNLHFLFVDQVDPKLSNLFVVQVLVLVSVEEAEKFFNELEISFFPLFKIHGLFASGGLSAGRPEAVDRSLGPPDVRFFLC